jgi:hypothetical protein
MSGFSWKGSSLWPSRFSVIIFKPFARESLED